MNTLTSPALQTTNYVEKKLLVDESEKTCYMVHGNDSLEVNSETHFDDSASFSGDDYMDADALNEELFIVCEKLIEKYKTLKKKSFALKKENEDLVSKLDVACLLYTSPSPRDRQKSRMPSSA